MRICHYRTKFSKLSETFIYDYLMELERQEVINHVITHARHNPNARPFPRVSTVKWPDKWDARRLYHGIKARLGVSGTIMGSYRLEARRRIASELRRVSPDVIHAHFGREGVVIAPVAMRLGIPLIVTFYGYDISRLPKEREWIEAYNDLWGQVEAVTVLSEKMKQEALRLGCPKEKLTIVHLSREIEQFQFRPPKSKVSKILFVGRLTPKKAPLDAIQAIESANLKGADLHLDIIGDGECRDEVEQYVDEHGLSDTITLHGYLPNKEVATRMQQAGAFLLPSKTAPSGDQEGTPTVLVEAQATGLPCVTTYHAGIPEMIPVGNHDLLVGEGDTKALSKALQNLATMEVDKLQAFARRGRKKVEEEFSLRGEVQKLCSVYGSVIDKARVNNKT